MSGNVVLRLNSILIAVLVVCPASYARPRADAPGGQVYHLQDFDRECGHAGHNCREAFQRAFVKMANSGGGTLSLPAGTFAIDFPDISDISPQQIGRRQLLLVPPNTTIQGHAGPGNVPDTILQWNIDAFPVFIFAKASHSGMSDLHIQYTGTVPERFIYGDIAILKAADYHPTFPHQNQMSGGNYEDFAFAYVFDSEFCTFNNLIFDSAKQDNQHVYGTAIDLKGKGVIESDGGGMSDLASSNRITNVKFYDFVMGIIASGQRGLIIDNIVADRRGSTKAIAPGHVLYTTSSNRWDAAGNIAQTFLSTDITVKNIQEGPVTYSNEVAAGTLSIKNVSQGQISNIHSQHPEGLLQTIYADQDVTFSDMDWQSNFDLCAAVPNNCSIPVIYTTLSGKGMPPTKNITLNNVKLVSKTIPITVMLMGDNLHVDSMYIESPAHFLPNQVAANAVLSIKNANHAVVRNYTYSPIVDPSVPEDKHNLPFSGWNGSADVDADVTIKWPKSVPLPKQGSHVITPVFQDKRPELNNRVRTKIVPKDE